MIAIAGQPLLGAKVLIAEDNPILAFDVLSLLRDAGAETVGPAKSLKDTLILAETSPLDCSILDVSLCDDLVFPAAKVLRDRGIGIVFYTGYGDPDSLRREWPSAQVLTKPVPPQLLIEAAVTACCVFSSRRAAPA
jgi:CheY-like chemotaxis protein